MFWREATERRRQGGEDHPSEQWASLSGPSVETDWVLMVHLSSLHRIMCKGSIKMHCNLQLIIFVLVLSKVGFGQTIYSSDCI